MTTYRERAREEEAQRAQGRATITRAIEARNGADFPTDWFEQALDSAKVTDLGREIVAHADRSVIQDAFRKHERRAKEQRQEQLNRIAQKREEEAQVRARALALIKNRTAEEALTIALNDCEKIFTAIAGQAGAIKRHHTGEALHWSETIGETAERIKAAVTQCLERMGDATCQFGARTALGSGQERMADTPDQGLPF